MHAAFIAGHGPDEDNDIVAGTAHERAGLLAGAEMPEYVERIARMLRE